MANLEVLALDTATPQIRAPGAGDGYSVPRDMTLASGTTLTAPTVNATTVDATNVEVTNVKAKDGTAAIVISDTTGNVGIGGTAQAFAKVDVSGTLPTGSNTSVGFYSRGSSPSGTTTDHIGFWAAGASAASTTLTRAQGLLYSGITVGAGGTITNQYGVRVTNAVTGATNNYGFHSAIASGANRWNFYAEGTAANYFAGAVSIGTTSTSDAGVVITPSVTRDGAWDAKLALQSTASGDYPTLYFSGCNATDRYGAIVQTTSTSGNASFNITSSIEFLNSSATAGNIVFKTNNTVGTGAAVERLRLKSTGQVRFQPLAADPAGAEAGDVYYNSGTNKLKVYDGSTWVDLN